MIEAAGHDRAVDKHAELVAQAVAELCAGFAGAQIRPVEFARALQIQVVAQKKAAVSHLGPVIACARAQKVENFAVARVRAAVVPEAQRDDDAFFRGLFSKVPDLCQIRKLLLVRAVVALKTVERDADLVQAFGGKQLIGTLLEQRAVRRDADLHIPRLGEGEERRKLRVQQRLAHHMQVDVLHIPLKPREDEAEFLCAHRARRALRLGAEGAGEVAAVCDLDIGFFQHRAAPFLRAGDRFKYFTISARFCKAFSLAPRRGVCYNPTSKLPSSTAKGETA